jgi:sugar O-acyltransferase (sialic acid O-acetyltransferase NeuD family)
MHTDSTLIVFGSGGHAKVVIDAAEKQGYKQILVADDAEKNWGVQLMGHPILGGREALLLLNSRPLAISAIGDNAARMHIAAWLEANGFTLATVIHPSAQVGRGARIGRGSVLVAGSIVNSDAVIDANVIVNTGATVDHDCIVGDGVHLAPGVHLCGRAEVGRGSFLGVGTVVIPCIHIGVNCVVGAGSVVLENIPDGALVAGVPARPLHQETDGIS